MNGATTPTRWAIEILEYVHWTQPRLGLRAIARVALTHPAQDGAWFGPDVLPRKLRRAVELADLFAR